MTPRSISLFKNKKNINAQFWVTSTALVDIEKATQKIQHKNYLQDEWVRMHSQF